MNSVKTTEQQSRWQFYFHGRAGDYFIICLTNFLLCIITLGIYVPWAMVRTRRYIYENMELNGARFGYHATGLALFLSWFLCVIVLVATSFLSSFIILQFVLLVIYFLILPVLLVSSIKYNAMMTTLNNIRFNFHCSLGRAWWVMLGLPAVLYTLLAVVILVIPFSSSYSATANIIEVILILVIFLAGTGSIAGIVYAKWIALLGEGGQFGIHRFSVAVSVKQCVKVGLLSVLIIVPFLAVIIWIFTDIFSAMMMARMAGEISDEMKAALMLDHMGQFIACYLLYFAAMLLSAGYLWMGLRNHFMNSLTMANGSIRFHSSIAFHALVVQWVQIGFVSVITLGLAYPLMKIRYLRFLAANTWIDGNLDTLELTDHDEQPEAGPIAVLSRGLMPVIPFI